MILQTLQELTRTGTTPVLEHLEQVEPDLASYLMETLTTIYHQILGLDGSAKKSRRIYRQVQSLALVCIIALRKGHYELWRQADGDDEDDGDDEEDESPEAPPPQLPPP
jgi:hypothetical protein